MYTQDTTVKPHRELHCSTAWISVQEADNSMLIGRITASYMEYTSGYTKEKLHIPPYFYTAGCINQPEYITAYSGSMGDVPGIRAEAKDLLYKS